MLVSGPSALLAFAAALVYTFLFTPWGRRALGDTTRLRVIAALALVGLISHLNIVRWERGQGASIELPLPHIHEIYHYYVGSKYFDELGYGALYAATVVADHEDAPQDFRADGQMRDLQTNRMDGTRGDALQQAAGIKGRFEPERWAEFKADIGTIRGWTDPDYWFTSGFLVDHGYNGTPLLTSILGGLANSGTIELGHFLSSLRWLDDYLLLLLGAILMGLDAPLTGLAFLAFALLNPLNEYAFIGNAYLRTDYLIPLVLAVLCLRRGWQRSFGVLIALSGWMRIFPLLLIGIVGLADLLRRDAAQRIKHHAPLYASFAIASLLILGVTSIGPRAGETNPWRAFVDNISGHSEELAANRIGLNPLIIYSRRDIAPDDGAIVRSRAAGEREAIATNDRRRGIALVASGALGLFSLYLARRCPTALLPIPWLLLVFAVQPLSHYYWAFFAILPVMAGADPRWHWLGGATLAALALTASPIIPLHAVELRFALYSAEILAFLLAASALVMHSSEEAPCLEAA